MSKHPRKKQRIESLQENPLGSVPTFDDDADKDDEERRLESFLFGKPLRSSVKKPTKDRLVHHGESEDDGEDNSGGGNEMGQLRDEDLFFVDDGAPTAPNDIPDFDIDVDLSEEGQDSESKSDSADQDSDDNSDDDNDDKASKSSASTHNESATPPSNPASAGPSHKPTQQHAPTLTPTLPLTNTKSRKFAAWADPDDSTLQVSLEHNKRLRKLRDAPTESVVGGAQYEAKLRREYERINPAPEWAAKARKKLHPKRRRSALDGDDVEDDVDGGDGIEDLLTSTNGILLEERRSSVLPKGSLVIERLRDANQTARAEGAIKSLAFHPSPKVSIMLTAGVDRRLRLFNMDGHTNPHLQTIFIPDLPITTAVFHPTGSSILMTGPRPFYYTYDLQSGTTSRSPRGLWGTTFASANSSKLNELSMKICAFDPSGEVLAIAGRNGHIHLVDWKSGAGQVVGSVKMNTNVKALCWSRDDGTGRGGLMSIGDDAEVYMWSVGERRCVRRWKDDGGFGSVVMNGDNNGRYLSVGSKTGLVNVYGSEAISSTLSSSPKPLKTLGNLTTSISALRYNHDSQLLAIASETKKDQMRLIHLPSLTAFSNWPTSSTPLGHVTAIDFSANSEYVAVGNSKGRVLLYHLPHFSAS